MEVLFVLIAISVLVLGTAAAVFLWAVRDGQFDDLTGPAYRVLGDDDEQAGPESNPPPGAPDNDAGAPGGRG
jgi:cbb3-type cytochrome oxidase maturation protein